jgi:hypothetical protein
MLPRVILVLAVIGIMIYAVIDCLSTSEKETRGLPKPLWLLVIVALPLAGGIMWILFGRAPSPGWGGVGGRLRTTGPDDDPDFLRSLNPPRPRPKRREDGEEKKP